MEYVLGHTVDKDRCVRLPSEPMGVLVVGSIGSGKTACVMKPLIRQAIEDPMKPGILIIDTKDDYAGYVRKIAETHGRTSDVVVLKPGGQHRTNLLVDWLSARKLADIIFSAALIDGSSRLDRFWEDQGRICLDLVISLLRAAFDDVTLGDVHKLMQALYYAQGLDSALNQPTASLIQLVETAVARRIMSEAHETTTHRRAWELSDLMTRWSALQRLDDRPKTSVLAEASRGLYPISSYEVDRVLCARGTDRTFDIRDVADLGKILIVDFPPHREGALVGSLTGTVVKRLLFAHLSQTRQGHQPNSRPIWCFIDECQNYLSLDDGPESDAAMASISRSLRLHLVLASQSIESLHLRSRTSDVAVRTLIRNLRTKVLLQQPISPELHQVLAEEGAPSNTEGALRSIEKFRAVVLSPDRKTSLVKLMDGSSRRRMPMEIDNGEVLEPPVAREDLQRIQEIAQQGMRPRAKALQAVGKKLRFRFDGYRYLLTESSSIPRHRRLSCALMDEIEAEFKNQGLPLIRLHGSEIGRGHDLIMRLAEACRYDPSRFLDAVVLIDEVDSAIPCLETEVAFDSLCRNSIRIFPDLMVDPRGIAVIANLTQRAGSGIGFLAGPSQETRSPVFTLPKRFLASLQTLELEGLPPGAGSGMRTQKEVEPCASTSASIPGISAA